MTLPDYQSVMLPLLKLVAMHQKLKIKDSRNLISDEFNLTKDERLALLPSGKQEIIYSRIGWARTYLHKAKLLAIPQRGIMEITERGRKVLLENPTSINIKYLEQFPEFTEFIGTTKETESNKLSNIIVQTNNTPEEVLEEAHEQLRNQVLVEIVDKLKLCSPQFFETLVVDTVVKMGYGGSRKDAGKAIGKNSDEGIDGIINEDRLGLDVIYLQAKRWQGNVGRPEIQKFAGALQGKRARKGIFITTSDFTCEAKDFVKHIEAKIILISGLQLAELMWEHNIALNTSAIYEVKKLDLDYFSE